MTGKRTLTSIPLHLDFIRKRKESQPTHFAQAIRLIKWWVDQRRQDTPGFDFRSFLVELIMAKLADDGKQFDDYHEGLVHFFSYIQRTSLRDRIAFSDNYPASKLPANRVDTVEIFDFTVAPAGTTDAHRPLGAEHQLVAILSHVEERFVTSDYTIRYQGKIYQIARSDIRPGLRGGLVRVEQRLDETMAVKFRNYALHVKECQAPAKTAPPPKPVSAPKPRPKVASPWMKGFTCARAHR